MATTNIDQVGFISSNVNVPRAALKENSKVQQEFTWSPGYDFVDDAEKKEDRYPHLLRL